MLSEADESDSDEECKENEDDSHDSAEARPGAFFLPSPYPKGRGYYPNYQFVVK